MKLRPPVFFPASVMPFLVLGSAIAEIIGVETFDYRSSQAISGLNGGTYWDFDNRDSLHTGTASSWVAVLGAPTVSGGRLETRNSGARRSYDGADEARGAVNDPASAPSSVEKSVYFRATVTTGDSLPPWFGFSSYDFGTERLFFGKTDSAPEFGVRVFGQGDQFSSTAAAPNTTYLLVAKLDFVANQVAFFIDPDLNASEPAPAASLTYTGTNWSTSVRLASGPGDPVFWDQLVVATDWDDLGTVVTTVDDESDGSLGGGSGISLREAVDHSPAGSLITFAPDLDGRTLILSGGELLPDRPLTLDASTLPRGAEISGNHSSRIFLIGSGVPLTLEALTLKDAKPPSGSAGGAIATFGNLRMTRCTVIDNEAVIAGAINQREIEGIPSTTVLDHCTFVGNRSTLDSSAGVIGLIEGSCDLYHTTITGNASAEGGGLFLNAGTSLSIGNSIVAGNEAPTEADIIDIGATILATGPNLIGNNSRASAAFPAGPLIGTAVAPVDPMLSHPGAFGGAGRTTHPLVGSPAIDAAAPGTTTLDQRGFNRLVGAASDLGSVEAGPRVEVTTHLDEDDGAGNGAGLSLREAIGLATSPGHRITFATNQFPRSIGLTLGEFSIPQTDGLFIDASNINGGVALNGGFGFVGANPTRILNLGADATVALRNIAIVNGKAPDGVGVSEFPEQGASGGSGGGILNGGGRLTLLSCTFFNNRAGDGSDAPEVEFGGSGGGGGALFSGPGSKVFIDDCRIEDNRSGAGGSGSQFGGFPGPGGGIAGFRSETVITDTVLSGNETRDSGGAIYHIGPMSLRHCEVIHNRAGDENTFADGGGIFCDGLNSIPRSAAVRLEDCDVSGNEVLGFGRGGGIASLRTELSLFRCSISRNQGGNAAEFGGGGEGGGVFSYFGAAGLDDFNSLRMENCTVSGNSTGTGGQGGGVFFGRDFDAILKFCTVTDNEATEEGGGVFFEDFDANNSFTLENCVVAGNRAPVEPDIGRLDVGTTYSGAGANLIGDPAGQTPAGGSLLTGPAPFTPLGEYGGPTPVHLPLPGSAIIDASAGTTPPTDQRGFPRAGASDLGAVESRGTTDIALYFDEDFDGDGLSFGVENALGTDVFTPDPGSSRNLRLAPNGPFLDLGFGYNPAAAPYTRWRVRRSTDLIDFSEIVFEYNGPTDELTIAPDFGDASGSDDFRLFFIPSPGAPRAFFLFESELVPSP